MINEKKKFFVFRFLPNDAAKGVPPPQWFNVFLQRIIDHNQAVLSLLGPLPEPFRTKSPKYLRAWLYDYRFTYKREQDPNEIIEKASPDQIGKTWYRIRVGIYAKASKKDN
jgi:hypothetical protein